MAITGTFVADFTSFQAAVDQAEVSLKGFEQGAGKVETSLNRMANSLSGTNVIQDATLMVEAVERIGGVSKLTESNLARVSATVSEATAQMRAMGIDVPPKMQKIADETAKVDTVHGSLISTVKNLALGFAAMFTARAAFNFVADVMADAAALKDLSQQTHINVEDLQMLAGAMFEFGVDADVLGRGLFTLGQRIAKGDDSVSDALLQMGMSLKDVQGLEGEELFLEIERGLSKLHGSLRDTTASELFGTKLGMAMAGASEGIDGAMESARQLNTVMSQESVDALDRYDEAIKRAQSSLGAMTANMIGPVAEGFNVLSDAMGKGAGKWDIFVAMTKDWAASNSITGASTSNLAKLLDDLNTKTDDGSTKTKAVTAAHREFVPALESTAGATKKAREEAEALTKTLERQAAAWQKTLSEIANTAGMEQMNDAIAAQARQVENLNGEWLMERDAFQLSEAAKASAMVAQAAQDAETQQQMDNMVTVIGETAVAHTEAGAAATAATSAAVQGYAAVAQQAEISGDAIRAFIELQKFSAASNAILSQNPLYTTSAQYQQIANLPKYDTGGPVLQDGPIYAHAGEFVLPKGGGAGAVVNNTFYVNGTGADVARQVMDEITRTMKVGRKWPAA